MPIQPELLEILACPDCNGYLHTEGSELYCSGCNRKFEIQNSIPLLYPKNLKISEFRENILLSEIENQSRTGKRAEYNAMQWKQSKQEFWEMIQKKTDNPPQNILYIGSGFDTGFKAFQKKGHFFINLDLINDTLETLKTEYNATHCIAGDLHNLPFQKQCFDALIMIDLLQYEKDLESILKNIIRFLKPQGQLFIKEINAWGLFRFFKPIIMPRSLHAFFRKLCNSSAYKYPLEGRFQSPTSYWKVEQLLKQFGNFNIQAYPIHAYPGLNKINRRLYSYLSLIKPIPQYLNYHYMFSAIKRLPSS